MVPSAVIPTYATAGAAGFDLSSTEDITIRAGETLAIGTGLAFELPRGFELQIRPRSGLSLNTFLRISNAPGTIDSDFRGEVRVIVTHSGMAGRDEYGHGFTDASVLIRRGQRIAQGVVAPVIQATFVEAELSATERGDSGFGSTGK